MDELKQEIRQLIVDALDLEDVTPDEIGDDMPLFGDGGLGLDSIDALELGVALRRKYQVRLEANDAGNRDHFRTVGTLAAFVASQQNS